MSISETIKYLLEAEIEFFPLRFAGFPLLKNKLFLTDKEYLMDRSQIDGEKDMIKLAETADKENAWLHFKDTGYWYHPKITGHKKIVEDDGDTIGMSYSAEGVTLEGAAEAGLGTKSISYHIHPDSFIEFYYSIRKELYNPDVPIEIYKWVHLPYPSMADLKTTLTFGNDEYKIATSLGLTSYKLHSEDHMEEDEWKKLITMCQHKVNYFDALEAIVENSYPKLEQAEVATLATVRKLDKTLGDFASLEFTPKSNLYINSK